MQEVPLICYVTMFLCFLKPRWIQTTAFTLFPKNMKRKTVERFSRVPAHQAATRNRRLPTDSSINFHVGGSTLFRPHTCTHTRTHKSSTWGGLPSHQSVRCSHNIVPIILSKTRSVNNPAVGTCRSTDTHILLLATPLKWNISPLCV